MKLILLALVFAYAYSAATYAAYVYAVTAAPHGSTKTNGTCNITQSLGIAFTGGTTLVNNIGMTLSSTASATTTSTSDWNIFCAYGTTQNGASTVATTFATAPACTLYKSSGSAYAASGSLTTTSAVTSANIAAFMIPLTYELTNVTTSNFTKTSLSLFYVGTVVEGGAVPTYTAAFTGGSAITADVSTCTTALKAFTSFSAHIVTVFTAIFGFSFF